ncbi:chromosomal replication initiator protein DnaA [Afipia sp. P52-10]|uniref:chromosomal replication initiator protein DnaA n=1 Tax=Afipia sp. P52-10 TaxID=1429916 RepID=UPI0003DF044A|nr:chromosomal replication initiator protein DnaA [Afipia sp. P52-10]ETR74928.1 chromosomal replication initiator protein DnaA [Afipia sp. P52-10]
MAGSAQPRQLAFSLPHAESLTREDFLEGPGNAAAVALIDRWPDWPARTVMLTGESGAGKSHLASIWAVNSGARLTAARALTAATVPDALATGALVIEDVAPSAVDERALFHLLNLARQQQADVLMTARTLPATWTFDLPDLASRLRAVPVVTLASPDDALLRALIVKLCMDRQLTVDESLVNYVAARIERSFAAARRAVDLLDRESLRLGRPVTRALASELLRGPAA